MVSSGYSSQLAFKKGSLRALWWRCVLEGMPYLAPLEALAKQRLSDLWETTLALLEQGKEEDERGNSAACLPEASAIHCRTGALSPGGRSCGLPSRLRSPSTPCRHKPRQLR